MGSSGCCRILQQDSDGVPGFLVGGGALLGIGHRKGVVDEQQVMRHRLAKETGPTGVADPLGAHGC